MRWDTGLHIFIIYSCIEDVVHKECSLMCIDINVVNVLSHLMLAVVVGDLEFGILMID